MAEDTVNTAPETPRLKLLDIGCEIEFNIENYSDEPYILVLVAWTILSAAYSADNDASIDILGLGLGQRRDVVHIQFHVDDNHTVENVHNRVQEELAAGNNNESLLAIGTNSANRLKDLDMANDSKVSEEASSSLPKVLITTNIDAVVYELIEESTYDLAITLDTVEGDKNRVSPPSLLKVVSSRIRTRPRSD